jgi:hypothetical protein
MLRAPHRGPPAAAGQHPRRSVHRVEGRLLRFSEIQGSPYWFADALFVKERFAFVVYEKIVRVGNMFLFLTNDDSFGNVIFRGDLLALFAA